MYGALVQMTAKQDISLLLDVTDVNYLQQAVGMLLYYAQAVDPTMLVALGTIAEQQKQGTRQTLKVLNQLLNYAASIQMPKYITKLAT